jgi:hypothetical protein
MIKFENMFRLRDGFDKERLASEVERMWYDMAQNLLYFAKGQYGMYVVNKLNIF